MKILAPYLIFGKRRQCAQKNKRRFVNNVENNNGVLQNERTTHII
jgi:hypothetical protein